MGNKKLFIGILFGFAIYIIFENYLRYISGNMDNFYLRTGISAFILIGLYLSEFRVNNNFLPSLYASVPYFISLCLVLSIDSPISAPLGIFLAFWSIVGG